MKTKLFFNIVSVILSLTGLAIETYAQHISENKAVVRQYFELVINQQKPDLLREIFAEDYLFHSLEDGSKGRGLEGLEDFLPYFFKAFPDIHYTIEEIVAEGDQVVVQAKARGTHKGEFMGYPPSNNKINVSEVFFYTLKKGKIIENRRLIDLFNLYQQLSKGQTN